MYQDKVGVYNGTAQGEAIRVLKAYKDKVRGCDGHTGTWTASMFQAISRSATMK